MEKLEKVELLREKTGVTYEEAKKALEANDYDVLEAILYLEALGKINNRDPKAVETEYKAFRKEKAKETSGKFVAGCKRILKKSWDSKFVIYHHDEMEAEIPVLILILATLTAFWVVIPLLIAGMFFDYRYQFKGVGKMTVDLNEMCNKASEACVNIKTEAAVENE